MKSAEGCRAYGANWKCIHLSQQNSTIKAPWKTSTYMNDDIKMNHRDKEYDHGNQ